MKHNTMGRHQLLLLLLLHAVVGEGGDGQEGNSRTTSLMSTSINTNTLLISLPTSRSQVSILTESFPHS